FFNSLRIELNKAVDILMVSPGWIRGTELKQRALGKQLDHVFKTNSKQMKQAVSLETCCNEIIAAMLKRKRELIVPKRYRWLPWLKLIVPALLDNIIRRKL